MTKPLKIAGDLTLPIEVVTEALAFLGRRGSGKTYAAQKLAEEMHRHQAQFVALDPVGIWYGLRLAADGKTPGLPVPVLGGLHGDIPLEVTGGALIADLVVDRGVSVVIDVSQFESDAQKARFAQAFADRFFFRKKASPSAVHIFLEECQEFIPQNPQGEETKMLHAFNRMVKIGRNFGIGMSMISQRPQEVNKKSLNLAEILFAFQMTGPQERKTIEGWIADKGIDEDIAAELPKLERGEPHVWSPALLKISRRVQIEKKTTFDASSTPKVGKEAAERTLSPIDLEQLRTDMAATIEKAKAEDPKLLRAEISRLKGELAKRPTEKVLAFDNDAVRDAEQRGFARGCTLAAKTLRDAADTVGTSNGEIARAISRETTKLGSLQLKLYGASEDILKAAPPAPVTRKESGVRPAQAKPPAAAVARGHVSADVSGPQQRILDSLAWLAAVGVNDAHKTQLALLAKASPTSSSYQNNLSTLRVSGLIDYLPAARVTLTPAGQAAAQAPDTPPTTEDLHRTLQEELSGPQWRILEQLVKRYPEAVDKTTLADLAGASVSSSSFQNNVSALRSLGFVDYPGRGDVVALPVLFLDR